MSLFTQTGTGCSHIYEELRDDNAESSVAHRRYLDGLWVRTRDHLDPNFRPEFARDTNQRFWEMRLTAAFLDLGYQLDAGRTGGPDIATWLPGDQRLWVEAVAPTLGKPDHPDRAPDLVHGDCRTRRTRAAPVEQILMRYTQALDSKLAKFHKYRRDRIVAEGECCVIAVSSGDLRPHFEGVGLPRILRAVYGLSDEWFSLNQETAGYECRDELVKANGATIPTMAFASSGYAMIGGLIHDTAWVIGRHQQCNAYFLSANNPMTNAPLPPAYFALGREYRCELDDDRFTLLTIEHRMDGKPTPR